MAVFAILLTFLLTDYSHSAETHGLLSMEDFYANDTGSVNDLNLLSTRLRMDTSKLNKEGSLSVHFDGRLRSNLSSQDFKSSSKNERIDTLNIAYTWQKFHLSAGRLWPEELPVERVDGINIITAKTDRGIGLFGGIRPNPYDDKFDSDFTSMGAYLFYRQPLLSTSLAVTYNGFKGRTDREYLYGQVSWFPVRELMLYSTLTADRKQETKNLQLSNGIIELSYRPDYKKSITVGYNQFRTFHYYRSMDFDVNNSRQQAYYASVSYRLLERYSIFGRAERQSMYYPGIQTNLKNSDNYRLGLTGDNFLQTGVNLNVYSVITDSYNSKNRSYNIDLSRLTNEWLQLIFTGSYIQNKYELSVQTNKTIIYGASGYLYLSKKWNISFSYDQENGKDYSANRISLRTSAKF